MRVLIVDDDPDCRLILEMMLGRQGWDLQLAAQAEEGLRLAALHTPRLVLMDLVMPQLGGLEAVALMRAMPTLAGTTFVAITAMAFEQERAVALAGGFHAVVTKPFSRRALMATIRECCPELGVPA